MIKIKKVIICVVVIIFLFSGCSNQQVQYIHSKYPDSKILSKDKYEYANEMIKYYIIEENENVYMLEFVNISGFEDNISLCVKINVETETINDIDILSHNETEDYGGYLTEEWFLDRFKGKSVDKDLRLVKMIDSQSNEIVAITGASITSQAVINGVNKSFECYRNSK